MLLNVPKIYILIVYFYSSKNLLSVQEIQEIRRKKKERKEALKKQEEDKEKETKEISGLLFYKVFDRF